MMVRSRCASLVMGGATFVWLISVASAGAPAAQAGTGTAVSRPQTSATAQTSEQAFKNIDDVLWKEAGCATELDYTEQTSWILFLKYLDEGNAYTSIPRPSDWLSAKRPSGWGKGLPW